MTLHVNEPIFLFAAYLAFLSTVIYFMDFCYGKELKYFCFAIIDFLCVLVLIFLKVPPLVAYIWLTCFPFTVIGLVARQYDNK